MGLSAGPMAASPNQAPQAPPPHPILAASQANVDASLAQHKKIAQVGKSFETIRSGLDSLSKLGEAVSAEDVVEELGKLVAAGLSPEPLIAMMAGGGEGSPPMPEGGPALAAWVQAKEQQFGQQEAQLSAVRQKVAHQTGVAGLQSIMLHHMEQLKAEHAGQVAQNPLAH